LRVDAAQTQIDEMMSLRGLLQKSAATHILALP
jgi:hypothetical protein